MAGRCSREVRSARLRCRDGSLSASENPPSGDGRRPFGGDCFSPTRFRSEAVVSRVLFRSYLSYVRSLEVLGQARCPTSRRPGRSVVPGRVAIVSTNQFDDAAPEPPATGAGALAAPRSETVRAPQWTPRSARRTRRRVVALVMMVLWIPMFAGTLGPVLQWFSGAISAAVILATVVMEFRVRRGPNPQSRHTQP